MAALPGRTGTLTARDVMTRDVITVAESDTIGNAVQTLKENRITGAPVIDDAGKFVGILSLSDLVHPGHAPSEELSADQAPLAHGEDATTWDLFQQAELLNAEIGVEQVNQRMSRKVTSVTDLTPLQWMRLTRLIFTPKRIEKGLEFARKSETLGEIDIEFPAPQGRKPMSPAEFWARFDAGAFK